MEIALFTYFVISVLIALLLAIGYKHAREIGEFPEDISTGTFVVMFIAVVVLWPIALVAALIYNHRKKE